MAVERIEAVAAANLRRCEQLREAVLAKAFRGELVRPPLRFALSPMLR